MFLLFNSQGATAPVGGYGGITLTQQANSKWLATPWFGGTNCGPLVPVVHNSRLVVLQGALTILNSYIANLSDVDTDN